MNKKFQWMKVMHPNNHVSLSLLRIVNGNAQFLASIDIDNAPYKFAARNKDGIWCSIDEHFYDLDEIQLQIEKFLFDESILEDGDIVESLISF